MKSIVFIDKIRDVVDSLKLKESTKFMFLNFFKLPRIWLTVVRLFLAMYIMGI